MRARSYLLASLSDRNHNHIGSVLPVEADCSLRFNAASTARLVVKNNHPRLPDLLDLEGVRATVWLVRFTNDTVLKHRLVEGQVGDLEGEGPIGEVVIPVIDDWEWLTQILAFPNPTLPITAQTAEFARYTGPSESRALAAIQANVTRLGLPWSVPASLGRGTTGTTDLRIEPLSAVADALTADRLRITLRKRPNEAVWDVAVSEGATYPRVLTPQSGVLNDWQWRKQRRRLTRVAVGGAGSGADRELAAVVDAAAEMAMGRIVEGFTDARGAEEGVALAPYGQLALAEAAPAAGISARLRESSWFRFPDAYDVGTGVSVAPFPGDPIQDVITTVDIHQARNGACATTPTVGFADTDPQARLTKYISALGSSLRGWERR